MENHRHAKTHKKATQIHPMSNNSFIKSYKKVVDNSIRLRYYKYEHRSLRTSQRANGVPDRLLFFISSLFYHILFILSSVIRTFEHRNIKVCHKKQLF